MTPDFLHYWVLSTGMLSLVLFAVAVVMVHRRLRSGGSRILLAGFACIVLGRGLQATSPVNDLDLDPFGEVLVTAGSFPPRWYAGNAISSLGLAVTAVGALALARELNRR